MLDNECIVYTDTLNRYSFLDMLIATYLRFYLESQEMIGISKEDFQAFLQNDCFDNLLEDHIICQIDNNLYNTNEDFTATRSFVPISIDIAHLFFQMSLSNFTYTNLNYIFGVYLFFKYKTRSRAYYGKVDNYLFSCKRIIEFLNLPYNKTNIDIIKNILSCLVSWGLIYYQEIPKKKRIWAPYELIGVAYNKPGELLTCQEFFTNYIKK